LTSLEPDFCDDIAAEASVTIIECAASPADDEQPASTGADVRSLRSRLHDIDKQPDDFGLDSGPHRALADEAIVEIVEIVDVAAITTTGAKDRPRDAATPARSPAERPRATSRFFNALSGR
jgi:hypothetical protein